MKPKIEKRKYPRVLIRALVDYESRDTFLYDYSRDLSQGGLFICTESPLEVGKEIKLKFSLPDVERVFEVAGEVRWVNEEDREGILKGMGVQFKNLSADDRMLLQEYVENYDKK
jgi:uncharacterized protein (TIGR02266 family)